MQEKEVLLPVKGRFVVFTYLKSTSKPFLLTTPAFLPFCLLV